MAEVKNQASDTGGVGVHGPYLIYLLIILLLINIINFVDRQIPFILAQSIKQDLHLTDTQLGLMGGIAFAVVYSVLGLPLGRLADRYGAKWVLVGSLSVWSGLTALGGFAQNFYQLAATRLGVAAGEAASTPAGHAIIANYFPPEKRGLPIAIFSLGVPLGIMTGLMLGGWINHVFGWREALILAGLPGIALAVLVAFTIRTPPKPAAHKQQEELPLIPSLKLLWRKPTFRQMAYALAVYSMGANAMIVFTPAFLMRTYELSSAGAGASLGIVYGIAGVAGVIAGGYSGDILGRKDARWRMWIPGIALAAIFPFTLAAWFAPTSTWSVILLAAPKFSNLIYMGPVFVALQLIAPTNMRALASAFLLFFNSLVGQAVGPFVVGYLSDMLDPTMGRMSLRYAMCFVVLTQVWAAVHFFLAARTLKADTIN